MKAWNRVIALTLMFTAVIGVFLNVILLKERSEVISNDHLTDINRAYHQLLQGTSPDSLSLPDIKVTLINQKDAGLTTYMDHAGDRIVLLPAHDSDTFYCFTYQMERIPDSFFWLINGIILFLVLFLLGLLLYIRKHIISPFHKMEELTEALKNRDFTYELPQQKLRFFGKFIWAIDVMRDELRHHEQQEVKLMKEKQTMIASLSHDIRTPLSNIRLYTDAMQEGLYIPQESSERVYENCDKIDHYIKEIMETSKEDLFDFNVQLEEVYLFDVEKLLKREEERIRLAMVSYEQESCPPGLIKADLSRLREVIGNVIDNALKYGDGKWIRVSFYKEDHHQIIRIENSGQGINGVDRTSIFQSFVRGTNVGPMPGNGLGLYICKQLMKKMEGDIFFTQCADSVSFHLVLELV